MPSTRPATARTQVVSFDNSHSNPVSLRQHHYRLTDSFITNVYAVDSSTGGAGAVLDDPRALTYRTGTQANAAVAHADVDTNPLTPDAGLCFHRSRQQGVLQSADFNVFSTGASGQAHTFKLALYEWNGSNAVGAGHFHHRSIQSAGRRPTRRSPISRSMGSTFRSIPASNMSGRSSPTAR